MNLFITIFLLLHFTFIFYPVFISHILVYLFYLCLCLFPSKNKEGFGLARKGHGNAVFMTYELI